MRPGLVRSQESLCITQRTMIRDPQANGTRKALGAVECHVGVNALKKEIHRCGIDTALIPRRLRVLSFINGIGGGIND